MTTARRAIVVVARYADGTRRAKACDDVEQARRFVSGEDLRTSAGRDGMPVGQGKEESRRDVYYRTTAELLAALRAAIA